MALWRLLVCVLLPPGVSSRTGKTPGGAGTHTATRDTRDRDSGDTHGTRGRTKAHGPRRRTSQPSKPTNNTHPARQRDDRSRGRLNSHRPGADRSPRPAQYMYRRTVYIWDACEVRLCDTCARVRPCVPCVSRVKRNRGAVTHFTGTSNKRCVDETAPKSETHFVVSSRVLGAEMELAMSRDESGNPTIPAL